MIYTYSNKYFLNNNPAKDIDIESNTNEKLYNFLIELQNIDLTTKLNQNPFSNPSKNDDTFINILTNIKQRVWPNTRVKINKKKHKKFQRMSRGILNSINSKYKLLKKLVKTSPDSPIFANLKTNFNTYKNIIRRSIVEAKKLNYKNTLNFFPNDMEYNK